MTDEENSVYNDIEKEEEKEALNEDVQPDSSDEAVTDDSADSEQEAEEKSGEDVLTEKKNKPEKPKKYHAPLYTAAGIFMAAILIFAGKQCFFNTDLDGTWGMTIKGSDGKEDMTFNLSFHDTEARLQSNGSVYIGRLTKEDETGSRLTDENGNSLIMLNMNLGGTPFVFKFNYEFSGNVFTGRTLHLTDLSGMFYEPEKDSDSEDVKERKSKTGFIKNDDMIYYVWDMNSAEESFDLKKEKDFKPDDKLTGSWLFKTEKTAYPYTITFNKDGTFENISYEYELHGTYSVKDGAVTLNWKELGNTERTTSINYKVDGKKLTLSQDTMNSELVKTDDKYSFKGDVK